MINPEELVVGPLLRPLSKDGLATVGAAAERRVYERGEILFREGDVAEDCFLLETGYVAIEIEIGSGKRAMIHTVSPGDFFGWSALVPPKHMTASARAVEPSTVIAIPGNVLDEVFEKEPAAGLDVMRGVSRVITLRLKDTSLQLVNVMDWVVPDRA